MLFYFYIVQAILQKNLFCVKMQETVTTHDTMRMGAVSSRSAKFNTAPVPAEPVTPKLRVYLHPCRTLDVWVSAQVKNCLSALTN